jgi:hypothetical protein
MSPATDLAFLVALIGAPEVLVFGVLLASGRQSSWVRHSALASTSIAGVALVTYVYLWWKSFEYTDAFRPVAPALDHAATSALVVCLAAGVYVVVLGVARRVAASRKVADSRA